MKGLYSLFRCVKAIQLPWTAVSNWRGNSTVHLHSLIMRYCRSEGTSFPPFVPLPPSISPSLPTYLSPSLDLSLSPSLPQSLPPSLLPSLSPSLPTPSTPPAGISLWFLPPSPSPTSSSLQEAQEAAVSHTPTDTVIYMYLCRSILALPFQVEMVCGW